MVNIKQQQNSEIRSRFLITYYYSNSLMILLFQSFQNSNYRHSLQTERVEK